MAAYSDPYRELELYLEKAQEEIGKAFEELLQHEATSASKTWNNVETVLPPPPAFRSSPGHTLCCSNMVKKADLSHNVSKNTMSRVCYDGTLLDLKKPSSRGRKDSDSLYLLQKSLSCSAAFSEENNKQMTNGHRDFSTNSSFYSLGKSKPKPFRSALFPEGAMDSILNKQMLNTGTVNPCCVSHSDLNPIDTNENFRQRKMVSCQSVDANLSTCNFHLLRMRQRSYSETSPPKNNNFNSEEHFYTFPRPPSGDVNLLSIWADNLVLEIDKTMPLELDDSVGSYSPLSDYSLSPIKNEDDTLALSIAQTIDDRKSHFQTSDQENDILPQTNQYKPNIASNHFKSMSPSPDSGIGPILYELSENEHTLNNTDKQHTNHFAVSKQTTFPEEEGVDATDSITPPPPGFEDTKTVKKVCTSFHRKRSNNVSTNMKDAETQVRQHALKVATCVTEQTDRTAEKENISKEIHRHARVIPSTSIDLDDCATVTTVCAVSNAPWNGVVFKSVEDYLKNQSLAPQSVSSIPSDCYLSVSGTITDEVFEDAEQGPPETILEHSLLKESMLQFSSLPKQINSAKDVDRYSCSLPRDAGRPSPDDKNIVDTPQRSASSSAVSSVSQVSMEELADFMRKVKTSTYLPPPRVDVSVDVKNTNDEDTCSDESIRDAVTQTSPVVPLSRSSSFTWVTECDCSDWDSSPRSESEDSWLAFSLSNTTTSEKKVPQSSSSGSTDDDGFDPPQNSGCSSLYLSACSEASDSNTSDSSLHEQKTLEDTNSPVSELSPLDSSSLPGSISSCGDPKTLPSNTVLMDIAEEETTVAEVPKSSLVCNFPKDLTIGTSVSLPNQLITDNISYQAQPIEAKVLVVNDADTKSLPTVILRPKKHSSPRKPHLPSSNISTSLTGISSKSDSLSRKEHSEDGDGASHNERKKQGKDGKDDTQLQAIEACRWLRATGFPQYAQMYEDNLFPIDIYTVQKDHEFLHPDSIQSLFRRLNTLNRCARMKFISHIPRKSLELDDSDEEEQCALSENWQFQRVSRRWSRVPSPTETEGECSKCTVNHTASPRLSRHPGPIRKYLTPEEPYSSSHDSVFVEDQHSSPDSIRRLTPKSDDQFLPHHTFQNSPGSSSGSGGTLSVGSEDVHEKGSDSRQKNLHRSGSDRIKEGAKALLRRMESLKGKSKKKATGMLHADNAKNTSPSLNANNGTDGSSCNSSITSSPIINRSCKVRVSNPQNASNFSQGGTPQLNQRRKGWNSLYRNEQETNAHSDSECPVFLVSEPWEDFLVGDMKATGNYVAPQTTLKVPEVSPGRVNARDRNTRTNVLKENQLSKKERCDLRTSHYDNFPAPLAVFNNAYVDSIGKESGQSKTSSPGSAENNDGEIIIVNHERRDSGVGASLTRGSNHHYAPWHSFPRHPVSQTGPNEEVLVIATLSASQVLLLRKLSMLKLTTLMEKFSSFGRTGWTWGLPKFMRRIRTPEYKEKAVFGVPLWVVLQRTGKALPRSIEAAMHYLRGTAPDSIGLFRKSGVRSRIQRLRTLNETSPETINYEDHQPYDVADMLKQYFRELPESLITNKLSETFIYIFSRIPEETRLEATRAALFIMPDENREVLQALLSFLREICKYSDENQMSATNLAVCFAPSLFHLSAPRSNASPRKRKTVGAPDSRELNENKTAYECLAWMVMNFEDFDNVTKETFSQSRLPCSDDYVPVSLDELSSLVHKKYWGWKTYIDGCIQAILKESKDKYRGWVGSCQIDNIDLSYKKPTDVHPLRLWKVSTEVEAPPTELLNRILREQSSWDDTFLKGKVIQSLDKRAEIFHYVCSAISPHPPCDYCVIRSWRMDLPKGACVLVEASISHPEAPILAGGVRAVVLASRYLIEPCGMGKSRITHISRVDTKGRSPEWYIRVYGHIATLNLMKLRNSFRRVSAGGPETKV